MARTGKTLLGLGASITFVSILATPASAGDVTQLIETNTEHELAIAVSKVTFTDQSTDDVVVTAPDDVDNLAMAAALAGSTPKRAPLLLTGGNWNAVRDEAIRVTGGPTGGGTGPTVWLVGINDPGFAAAGFTDIRSVDETNLLDSIPGGNDGRAIVYPPGDRDRAEFAAAFGATFGIAVLPGTAANLARIQANNLFEIVSFGPVAGANTTIDGQGQMGMTIANFPVVEREIPDAIPYDKVTRPVSADGSGPELSPPFLASMVTAWVQDDAGRPPLLIVDGRPDVNPTTTCGAGTAADYASHCYIAASAGPTIHVGLIPTTPDPANPNPVANPTPVANPDTGTGPATPSAGSSGPGTSHLPTTGIQSPHSLMTLLIICAVLVRLSLKRIGDNETLSYLSYEGPKS